MPRGCEDYQHVAAKRKPLARDRKTNATSADIRAGKVLISGLIRPSVAFLDLFSKTSRDFHFDSLDVRIIRSKVRSRGRPKDPPTGCRCQRSPPLRDSGTTFHEAPCRSPTRR